MQIRFLLIGQSEKSGIEIESEYQLTGHPVLAHSDFQTLRHPWVGIGLTDLSKTGGEGGGAWPSQPPSSGILATWFIRKPKKQMIFTCEK